MVIYDHTNYLFMLFRHESKNILSTISDIYANTLYNS